MALLLELISEFWLRMYLVELVGRFVSPFLFTCTLHNAFYFNCQIELGDSSKITIAIVATITIPIVKLSRYYSFHVNVYIMS